MKTCSKCKLEKSLVSFSKKADSKDGLMPICNICNRERARAWQLANPERAAAKKKAWYHANRELAVGRSRAWYNANRERAAATHKAWAQDNPDRINEFSRRRRARKRCVVTEVDMPTDIDLIAATGGICAVCGEAPDKWHIDHIWPLSKGGPHIRENLQAICESCNHIKNASLPDQNYPYPPWYDPNVVRACVEIALEEDEDVLLYFEPD